MRSNDHPRYKTEFTVPEKPKDEVLGFRPIVEPVDTRTPWCGCDGPTSIGPWHKRGCGNWREIE